MYRELLYFNRNYPEAEFYPSFFRLSFSSHVIRAHRRHAPHNNFIGWKKRRKRGLCVHVGPNEACTVKLFSHSHCFADGSRILICTSYTPVQSDGAENPFGEEEFNVSSNVSVRGDASRRSSPSPSNVFPLRPSSFRTGASRFFSSNVRLRDVSGAR